MSTQFHVLKLVQGGGTLVDFVDFVNYAPNSFSPDLFPTTTRAQSVLNFDVLGSSNDNLIDNFIALQRAILAAQDNAARFQRGQPFTPIFLQLKLAGSTTALQTEVLDAKMDKPTNFLDKPIVASRFKNLNLTLTHRPYFEETAPVALAGSPFTVSNNGGLCNIASTDIRGDLPAPLKITFTPGGGGADRLTAALKAVGTVANFVAKYEAESYAGRGAGVADLSDANLSPGGVGVTGQRWTPPNTNEQVLIRISPPAPITDHYGRFRVLVRCRDNAPSTPNVKIRARGWRWDSVSGLFLTGDWGDVQKFATVVGGTTVLPLIDCGLVAIPPFDYGTLSPSGSSSMGVEIDGQAVSTSYTFDLDCLYLLPGYEGGGETGLFSASFPYAMASPPYGVLDANDRVPDAYYVDGSGNANVSATDLRGDPILAWPNRAQKLLVMASVAANGNHYWNANNVVAVTCTPRYRLARGA